MRLWRIFQHLISVTKTSFIQTKFRHDHDLLHNRSNSVSSSTVHILGPTGKVIWFLCSIPPFYIFLNTLCFPTR